MIACRNGFAVHRDARSVGEYTTCTVVQSLVAVILINAMFAIASRSWRSEGGSRSNEPILRVEGVHTHLGGHWVHKGINLSIGRGEVVALIGGSGTGKSVLLRESSA